MAPAGTGQAGWSDSAGATAAEAWSVGEEGTGAACGSDGAAEAWLSGSVAGEEPGAESVA